MMNIQSLPIEGLRLFTPKVFQDSRGYFLETFRKEHLTKNAIFIDFIQDNLSYSKDRFTLRGLHFQKAPLAQDKLISVVKGSILDVAVVKTSFKSYKQYYSIILSDENHKQILVPKGFAHGFLTLEPDTIISYKVSNYYNTEHNSGILWNDPDLNIDWRLNGKDPFYLKDHSSNIFNL